MLPATSVHGLATRDDNLRRFVASSNPCNVHLKKPLYTLCPYSNRRHGRQKLRRWANFGVFCGVDRGFEKSILHTLDPCLAPRYTASAAHKGTKERDSSAGIFACSAAVMLLARWVLCVTTALAMVMKYVGLRHSTVVLFVLGFARIERGVCILYRVR